jgi:hypothetical protein
MRRPKDNELRVNDESLLSSDVDSFATSREFVSRDEFADGIICFI